MLMEKCYECILDAGLHPSDLAGTRTGVFVGAAGCGESDVHWYTYELVPGGNAILGYVSAVRLKILFNHQEINI